MALGTLYGIGIGPGDPDLITVKGARIISQCGHVFVPKARKGAESVARSIAEKHIGPSAMIHEIVFPMTQDRITLTKHWEESARQVAEVLQSGADACFLTLGDALLYSTYIYLIRSLKKILPAVTIVTIPGITAFSAAAALTNRPVGEGKRLVTVVPTADDLGDVRRALETGGTVILMKIANRLGAIIDLLEEKKVVDRSVLVSRAGMEGQRIETDLRSLRGQDETLGYLSVIIVSVDGEAIG
jgi:precorrin-2/cobalt-factor-2 C20-methyltransferase